MIWTNANHGLLRNSSLVNLLRAATYLLLFAAVVSLASSLQAIWRNGYLGSRQYYLATDLLIAKLNADILFAAAICAILLLPVATARRLGTPWLPYAGAAAFCLIASRGVLAREWAIETVARGLTVPLVATGGYRYRVIAAAIILSTAIVVLRTIRRKPSQSAWARAPEFGPFAVRALTALTGLLLLANVGRLLCSPSSVPRPAPVIWVTWDSVRADRLSAYGYTRRTTPNVDEFANQAVLFERAFSQDNWTRPSYSSMFASRHIWEMPFTDRMDESVWTLAEALKAAGYRTVAQVQNPNLDASFNFDQGFDRYIQLSSGTSAKEISRRTVALLSSLAGRKRPFFLFIHFQEPHYPYDDSTPHFREFTDAAYSAEALTKVNKLMSSGGKSPSLQSEREELLGLLERAYDADLRTTDDAFGPILQAIKDLGLYDRSLIILNSDHGEELNDRGSFGHGRANVHSELTWIPLIIRFPKSSGVPGGVRVRSLVRNLDVYPTVLDVIGARPPRDISGHSLTPKTNAQPEGRVSYSNWGSWLAVRNDRYSLVLEGAKRESRVYDLDADPHERAPLAIADRRTDTRDLENLSRRWVEVMGARVEGKTETRGSKELVERLRSLGYVQ